MTGETAPGTDTQSDQQWEDWLKENVYTEYHPSCSCAMLPQAQGGVVGADLKVYGLTNVRVVDASVLPLQISAHLQSTLYGVAEKAADLIKAAQ